MINVNFELKSSDNVYTVSGDDNTEKPIIRYRAITNGLIKYGGFERKLAFCDRLLSLSNSTRLNVFGCEHENI